MPTAVAPLSQTTRTETTGPTAIWLCAGFLLAGMGTVLLGPILPYLAGRWHLQDVDSGLLLFAKFTGAFLGGISVPSRLRHGILYGLGLSFAGFTAFAFATGPYTGAATLFLCGIGLGLIIASTNILAGLRYSDRPGSALALINFFWAFGAVTTGILIAALLPHHSLGSLLIPFASLSLVVAVGGAAQRTGTPSPGAQETAPDTTPLPRPAFLLFAAMLFLYGGLETCLTQWLTTYSVRYTTGEILGGQSAIVVLWSALTLGRALTAALLRRMGETSLQRLALVASVLLIPVLATRSTASGLSITCILLGLALAPFFPTTFGILLRHRPPAREAGLILAVSGLGAAGLTWLMGFVSTHAGGLRIAMAIPFAAAVALLAASFARFGGTKVRGTRGQRN